MKGKSCPVHYRMFRSIPALYSLEPISAKIIFRSITYFSCDLRPIYLTSLSLHSLSTKGKSSPTPENCVMSTEQAHSKGWIDVSFFLLINALNCWCYESVQGTVRSVCVCVGGDLEDQKFSVLRYSCLQERWSAKSSERR